MQVTTRLSLVLFGLIAANSAFSEPAITLPGEVNYGESSQLDVVQFFPATATATATVPSKTATVPRKSTHADRISWPCPKEVPVQTS